MSRRSIDRIPALCEAAHGAFLEHGYRNAQVADVAARMGISVGAVYRHVVGKEALFELALRWSLGLPIPDGPRPLSAAPFEEVTRSARARLSAVMDWAWVEGRLAEPPPADGRAELRAVLRLFYHAAREVRFGVKLLDRCFPDIPALRDTHIELVKGKAVDVLTRYLETRSAQGVLRAPGGSAMAARAMMEAAAWMAVHRSFDPMAPTTGSPDADEAAAEEAVVEMIVGGLVA